MNSTLRRLVPFGLGAVTLMVATPAFAQSNPFNLLSNQFRISLFEGSFNSGLANILNFVLLIAGLLAFFYVLYGGFVYLTAGGDASKADTGRKIIINALIGVILIFISFSLVRFIVLRTQDQFQQDEPN